MTVLDVLVFLFCFFSVCLFFPFIFCTQRKMPMHISGSNPPPHISWRFLLPQIRPRTWKCCPVIKLLHLCDLLCTHQTNDRNHLGRAARSPIGFSLKMSPSVGKVTEISLLFNLCTSLVWRLKWIQFQPETVSRHINTPRRQFLWWKGRTWRKCHVQFLQETLPRLSKVIILAAIPAEMKGARLGFSITIKYLYWVTEEYK